MIGLTSAMQGLSGMSGIIGSGATTPPPPAFPWWLGNDIPEANCKAAWAPTRAACASISDTYIDVTGNGNTLLVGSAPTWPFISSWYGWHFNGSSNYLKTPFNVPNDCTWSILVCASSLNWSNSDTHFGLFGWFHDIATSQLITGFGKVWRILSPDVNLNGKWQTGGSHRLLGSNKNALVGILGQTYRHVTNIDTTPVVSTFSLNYYSGLCGSESDEVYIGATKNLTDGTFYGAYCDIKFVSLYDTAITATQMDDVYAQWKVHVDG